MSPADLIEASAMPEPMSGCWIWLGALTHDGYGRLHFNGRTRLAHRVYYEATRGPVLPGITLDHRCRVRCCVNPDHLEPVTWLENVMRGISFSAVNARKTHCNNGHPLSGDNVYLNAQGRRRCRQCERAAGRRYHARVRAALAKAGA